LKERWFNPVFVSQIAIFVEFFGFGEQITLLPFFLNEIGESGTGLGMILAAQQGGIVIGSTLLGWFSDTHGRKKAVMITLVANVLLAVVAAVCQTQMSILIVRFVTGLMTISTPSLSWLLANCTSEEKPQVSFKNKNKNNIFSDKHNISNNKFNETNICRRLRGGSPAC